MLRSDTSLQLQHIFALTRSREKLCFESVYGMPLTLTAPCCIGVVTADDTICWSWCCGKKTRKLISWKFQRLYLCVIYVAPIIFMKPEEVWRQLQDKQLNNARWVHWFIDSNTSAMLLIVYKCDSPTVAWTADKRKAVYWVLVSIEKTKYIHIMVKRNKYKICVSWGLDNE